MIRIAITAALDAIARGPIIVRSLWSIQMALCLALASAAIAFAQNPAALAQSAEAGRELGLDGVVPDSAGPEPAGDRWCEG
jgi:hypothetical protein